MPVRASVIFINKQEVWHESNFAPGKPLVPMSSAFIRKQVRSRTIMSQVLLLSSDLGTVCLCRGGLPLLSIKRMLNHVSLPPAEPWPSKTRLIFGEVSSILFHGGRFQHSPSGGAGPSPWHWPPDLLDLRGGLDKGSLSLLILPRERYMGPDPVLLLTFWTSGLMSMI